MGTSKAFENEIKSYLDDLALNDKLFAKSYAKENKSLNECCNFILQEVKKSGCSGFSDSEIFGMAMHYYDEDNLKDIKPASCNVVVNRSVRKEEKKAPSEPKTIKAPKRTKEKETEFKQMSLFE